jgi:hypothetical protein
MKGGGGKGAEAFEIRRAAAYCGRSGEGDKLLTIRQLVISQAGGTVMWIEQRAALIVYNDGES